MTPTAPTAQAHTDAGPTELAAQRKASNFAVDVIRVDLGDGHQATIDALDFPVIAGYRWRCLHTPTGRQYAVVAVGRRTIYMHRLIAGTPDGMTTDHANNDGLDNRRANLRLATWTQNVANVGKQPMRRGRPTTSQYKGVSWDKSKKLWAARAKVEGRGRFLGRYASEVEAARAYDAAASAAWGEFAVLNFPERVGEPTPYVPGRKKPPPKTHCPQNHEFTPENTYTSPSGYRHCRACKKASDRARWSLGLTAKQKQVAA